jgi:glycosyltransferase involved in cell wall biosynthesis
VIEAATLAGYYTQADVLLLPSRTEGVPLAALEAMSFGNIVIATNVGGLNEVIENGKNGFLLDATQSEESLATGIRAILADIIADPRRHDEIRVEACTAAMELSWTRSAARLAELIDAILD